MIGGGGGEGGGGRVYLAAKQERQGYSRCKLSVNEKNQIHDVRVERLLKKKPKTDRIIKYS